MNYALRAISLLSVIFISACQSSGSLKPGQPAVQSLASYRSLVVDVSTDTNNQYREMVDLLAGTMVGNLREQARFEQVSLGTDSYNISPDLRLQVRLTKIRVIGDTTRFFLGALAGRGSIQGVVTLFDVNSGAAIASAEVESKTGDGTIFSAGESTTYAAVERFSEQVVQWLVQTR